MLTTPLILWWTSQFTRVLIGSLWRIELIKAGHYRFLSKIKRFLKCSRGSITPILAAECESSRQEKAETNAQRTLMHTWLHARDQTSFCHSDDECHAINTEWSELRQTITKHANGTKRTALSPHLFARTYLGATSVRSCMIQHLPTKRRLSWSKRYWRGVGHASLIAALAA